MERYDGIFVTADTKLENRKLFFKGTPVGAVSFATDVYLAHSVNKNFEECYPALVLQQADYEFGFSGVHAFNTSLWKFVPAISPRCINAS